MERKQTENSPEQSYDIFLSYKRADIAEAMLLKSAIQLVIQFSSIRMPFMAKTIGAKRFHRILPEVADWFFSARQAKIFKTAADVKEILNAWLSNDGGGTLMKQMCDTLCSCLKKFGISQ